LKFFEFSLETWFDKGLTDDAALVVAFNLFISIKDFQSLDLSSV
jgi:hypothetical protein